MIFISAFLSLLVITDNKITNDSTNRFFPKASRQDQSQSAGFQQSREILIRELQILKVAFNHKDKIAIGKYFKFPLADSAFSISYMDKRFDNELKINGNKITKEMFQKYFARIYEYLQMEEFSKLFVHLNTTDLLNKYRLTRDVHHKNSGCYHIYEIIANGSDLTLFYGTNSDTSYLNKHPDEETVCEEHSYIWTLIFDGQRLHFKKLIEAD
jgi:hypothetical protein